jgi:hypothetical protein
MRYDKKIIETIGILIQLLRQMYDILEFLLKNEKRYNETACKSVKKLREIYKEIISTGAEINTLFEHLDDEEELKINADIFNNPI